MKNMNIVDLLSSGPDFDPESFRNPNSAYFPTYFWEWNGVLSREEIKKQIDEMYASDIKGFLIEPLNAEFCDLIPSELKPDYLSDDFMECIRYAVECAAEKKMNVWIYDEAGWPSGAAGGFIVKQRPELAKKALNRREVTLQRGETYQMPKSVLAAFLGKKRIEDGYVPQEAVIVSEYYVEFLSDYLVDVSEPEAVELLLESTHNRYKDYIGKYFGNTVTLMFTDECYNPPYCFPTGFDEKFKKKYGYDVLDYLPVIYEERVDIPIPEEGFETEGYLPFVHLRCGDTEAENQVLLDYYSLCGEIYNEVFLSAITNWCDRNGILAGGHLDSEHIVDLCPERSRTNIVDSLRRLRVPGIDAIWRQIMRRGKKEDIGIPFYPRFASSAAHMNGTNLAMTECFGVYGQGLTMDDMRHTLNCQISRGINLLSVIGVVYARTKYLTLLERPSFDIHKPGYFNLPLINNYLARASYINTLGKSGVEVALYLPENDIQVGGEFSKKASKAFVEMGILLEKQGIAFDVIEDYGIREGECLTDALRIGNAEYKYVYIPENQYMPNEVRAKLEAYVKEANPVVDSSAGFEALRVNKRCLPDGAELFYLFNEECENLVSDITVETDATYLYELNLVRGEIYQAEYIQELGKKTITVRLQNGEEKALLSSSVKYETTENALTAVYDNAVEIKHFQAAKVFEFYLDLEGSHSRIIQPEFVPMELGLWNSVFGDTFSGDVVYRCQVTLEKAPRGKVLIDLGKVNYSARVLVNGKLAGLAGVYPMMVVTDGELFTEGENEICIIVSNTGANQCLLSGVDKNWRPGQIDPYNKLAKRFEAESIESGLYGPVIINYNCES